jgi:ubiquinone/menaquinone biosynthesis C-methylase UbiE
MEKVRIPTKPAEDRYVFTEGIDYFTTGKTSIWGPGDPLTLKLIAETEICGRWLNLAAGDGRYNLELLKKANEVVASDIDKSALSKLWHTTPKEYRKKLSIRVFDITERFPFDDASFNGVFCTGILHLFPKQVLKCIVGEITRVLKPGGMVIIDFATM